MITEGSVTDFDSSFRSTVQTKVADTANVTASDVSVSVSSASVLLRITVTTYSSAASSSVHSSLQSSLGTAESATSYIGATVTSTPSFSTSTRVRPVQEPLGAAEYTVPSLLVLHAVLMGAAWLLMAPLGVIIARYGKPPPSAPKGGGPDKWFIVHRATQSMAVLLTVVGVIMSISETDSLFQEHLFNAHTTMGVIVSAVALVQPFAALARPAKDAATRPAWKLAHQLMGYSTVVCAIVVCALGAKDIGKLYKSAHGQDDQTGDALLAVFLAIGGLWAGCMLIGEIYRVSSGKDAGGVQMSSSTKPDQADLKVNQC